MTERSPRWPAAGLVVALALSIGAGRAHEGGRHESAGAAPRVAPAPEAGALPPGLWRADVVSARLVDHRGRPFSLGALAGRPVLLHFFFADCVSVCSVQLRQLANVYRALRSSAAGNRFGLVSVTVNPEIDSPSRLAGVRRAVLGAEPSSPADPWYFVGGDPATVERLGARFGYMRATAPDGQPEHATGLYLLGRDGRLLQRYRGVPVDEGRVLRELRHLAVRSRAQASRPARP